MEVMYLHQIDAMNEALDDIKKANEKASRRR